MLTRDEETYALLQARACVSLLDYAEWVNPEYKRTKHGLAIIGHLEALERGEIQNLIIAMPPRHGKSLHAGQLFPSWFLGRNPTHQVISASYNAELAEENSVAVREYINGDKYPFPDIKMSEDSTAKGRWKLSAGGGYLATGVGGSATGFGASLFSIDDPFKDRETADSPRERDRVWKWYTDVARTRAQQKRLRLVMATRWHDDDLTGRILNSPGSEKWRVLSLPALAEEDDPLGRAPGGALWPEFMDEAMLLEEKASRDARSFESLYQQKPVPDGGVIFKADWFKHEYTELPQRMFTCIVVDSAWKTGAANDYSVIATWATDFVNYYLVDVVRGRWEYPQLRQEVVSQYWAKKAQAVFVEDTAAGIGLIQELKSGTGLPIVAVKCGSDRKEAKAERVTPFLEAGKVFIPKDAAWKAMWLDEHLRFPGAPHDDMVDTTQIALRKLAERVTAQRPDYSRYQGWMAR